MRRVYLYKRFYHVLYSKKRWLGPIFISSRGVIRCRDLERGGGAWRLLPDFSNFGERCCNELFLLNRTYYKLWSRRSSNV